MAFKNCTKIALRFGRVNLLILGFLLIFSYYPLDVNGQTQLHFTQLTQSFTNCVIKDSDGFIWVGTQDGLMRYENYKFKVFRYQSDDKYSLPNNYIKDIIEDKNQNLWIGTFGGGLVQWDRSLERFYTFPINTNSESIHSLALYQDSILLIGSENGLIKFNIKTKSTENLSQVNINDATNFINDIYISHENDIYLGTNEGFYRYNMKSNDLQRLENESNLIVYCIKGKAHRIYLGTNKGLFIYNKRKNTFKNHVSDKNISTILLTNTEQLYLGSSTGIGHYKDKEQIHWYTKSNSGQNGLQSDHIHTLYNLDEEIIWAGTRKGVHQFSFKPPAFNSLQKQYSKLNCSSTALGMAEDKNKDIWICSREGLMHFDVDGETANWKAHCHTPENTEGMKNNYTINITNDSNNDLWLAYRKNGFSRIREVNNTWVFENFPKVLDQLGGDGVNQVFQDMSGRYWLASRGKGLIRFFIKEQKLKIYDEQHGLSHPYVFRIYQSKIGQLWLSTANGGLCLFDIENETFECKDSDLKNPQSISANMVLATNQSSDGKLLACTTAGLNILESDNTFTVVHTRDGLPSDVIYGALEDDNGKIWVSTNEGISKLDLSQDIPNVTNYNKSHGLASFEFNQHSFLEHSSGLFLFGGVEGVTVFDPTDIEDYKAIPNIAFTDFQLFNKSVAIGTESNNEFSLKMSINKIDKIELAHNQNSIAFEFSALGIANNLNSIYQYKLEGLEKEWVNASLRNYASYPKIPHGEYNFKVRLVDLNKNVISPSKSVQLFIATPPWKTWWANLIYFISLLGSIYLITRIQKARTLSFTKVRENERDVFRKKLARDFHDEAGNKITRISLITDNITRRSQEEETVKTLNKLQDNIQDLRLGMTDFIWVLDPGKDSLSETLRRFMDFANDTFEYSNIEFKMQPIKPELDIVFVESNIRRHFLLIMKEATTNILKHANADQVNFSYSNSKDVWTFTISDNGVGFDLDEIKRVNGLNNMSSRANKINGKLEVKSNKNEGSQISLMINL